MTQGCGQLPASFLKRRQVDLAPSGLARLTVLQYCAGKVPQGFQGTPRVKIGPQGSVEGAGSGCLRAVQNFLEFLKRDGKQTVGANIQDGYGGAEYGSYSTISRHGDHQSGSGYAVASRGFGKA